MTPDEIKAERERFEAWAGPLGYNLTRNNHGQYTIGYTHDGWKSFLRRAEIARAEQAELRALLAEVYRQAGNGAAPEKRHVLTPALRDAIRDVVYPNNKWRERMGGAG